MSGIRDRPQAQAPRPFMPKLANASPTTFPRSPPKPRLAGQTLSPSITASLQARRPLTAVNTPPTSRQSPSNGRYTPSKVGPGAPITPRSGARPGAAESIPVSTMAVNSRGNYTPPLSGARPMLVRGATTASLPPLNERTNGQPRRGNGALSPLNANRTTSPVNLRPNLAPKRTQTTPPTHTAPFFHANDVPARSPSPEQPPLNSMMGFVYARTKEDNGPISAGADQEQDAGLNVSMVNDQDKFGPRFIDAASAHKLKTTELTSTLGNAVVHGTHSEVETEPLSRSNPASPTKRGIHVSDKPAATQNIPSTLSKRLSGNGQPRQPGTDNTSNPPNQGKARSTSTASSTAMFKPGQNDPKPFNAPIRPGLRSNRSSMNPTEPTSPILNASAVPNPSESSQSTTQPDPTNHPGGIAASARHERKLLDLEISNSSLLAINRTLEREVAKQKAELKRLRRATIDRNSWISDTTEESSEVGSRISSGDGGEDDYFLDEHGADVYDQSRPTDAKRVSRRNLQLDFSKHKELLIENQKMNMTLQKCLGITDKLIRDGDKALQYRVTISELGDDEDNKHHNHHWESPFDFQNPSRTHPDSLITSATTKPSAAESFFQTWGALSTRTSAFHTDVDSEPTDRDSGIDVGYMSSVLTPSSVKDGRRFEAPGTPLEEIEREMF